MCAFEHVRSLLIFTMRKQSSAVVSERSFPAFISYSKKLLILLLRTNSQLRSASIQTGCGSIWTRTASIQHRRGAASSKESFVLIFHERVRRSPFRLVSSPSERWFSLFLSCFFYRENLEQEMGKNYRNHRLLTILREIRLNFRI